MVIEGWQLKILNKIWSCIFIKGKRNIFHEVFNFLCLGNEIFFIFMKPIIILNSILLLLLLCNEIFFIFIKPTIILNNEIKQFSHANNLYVIITLKVCSKIKLFTYTCSSKKGVSLYTFVVDQVEHYWKKNFNRWLTNENFAQNLIVHLYKGKRKRFVMRHLIFYG